MTRRCSDNRNYYLIDLFNIGGKSGRGLMYRFFSEIKRSSPVSNMRQVVCNFFAKSEAEGGSRNLSSLRQLKDFVNLFPTLYQTGIMMINQWQINIYGTEQKPIHTHTHTHTHIYIYIYMYIYI